MNSLFQMFTLSSHNIASLNQYIELLFVLEK